jgi:sugar phosphate isomerase/epimerase
VHDCNNDLPSLTSWVEFTVPDHWLLSETDTDNIKMEPALAWVVKGGKPDRIIKKFLSLVAHKKNWIQPEMRFFPVGSGTVAFETIFENISTAGMQHFFVNVICQRCFYKCTKQLQMHDPKFKV